MKVLVEQETRVTRTYSGGKLLDKFLNKSVCQDGFCPEYWISSFTEAKNREYIKNEGITKIEGGKLITDEEVDFGKGRSEYGVLIKLLDAGERLGIQVHPTKEYAKKYFNNSYGKTECWHILDTRDENACIYLGFKENVTPEYWRELFEKQDIEEMLNSMHCYKVMKGDTILVTGGTPHAIGAGCFLLEIQEPSDYTMRAETVTVAGERLTPLQIHYGVGVDAMLECFSYLPKTREQTQNEHFLKQRAVDNTITTLVNYDDTDCFGLIKINGNSENIVFDYAVTIVSIQNGGTMNCENEKFSLSRGEVIFITANTKFSFCKAEVLICIPPKEV